MAMIELIGLHKSFGSLQVLRGVNLAVEKGESMTVIGGSGSGKSVILKHIIGLLFPDRGRVVIEGQVLNDLDEFGLNELRKKFGMLFQMAALFDSLTVWENVGFSLKQHTKLSDREIRKVATEKLALVGLKDVEDKMPSELSGGMKKRVGLARAICMNADAPRWSFVLCKVNVARIIQSCRSADCVESEGAAPAWKCFQNRGPRFAKKKICERCSMRSHDMRCCGKQFDLFGQRQGIGIDAGVSLADQIPR